MAVTARRRRLVETEEEAGDEGQSEAGPEEPEPGWPRAFRFLPREAAERVTAGIERNCRHDCSFQNVHGFSGGRVEPPAQERDRRGLIAVPLAIQSNAAP